MSEKPINPLRQRMLEDMSVRGFTPDTQRDYIRAVKKLAAFLGRSPDTARSRSGAVGTRAGLRQSSPGRSPCRSATSTLPALALWRRVAAIGRMPQRLQ
jgi:hypothetical protein